MTDAERGDGAESGSHVGIGRERELVRLFAQRLGELRVSAGEPSFRTMAGVSGAISHTTLHDAVRGARLPSWPTVREFVRACRGDEGEWRTAWQEAHDASVAARPRPERFEQKPATTNLRDDTQALLPSPRTDAQERPAHEVVSINRRHFTRPFIARRRARLWHRSPGRVAPGTISRFRLGAALLATTMAISAAVVLLKPSTAHGTGARAASASAPVSVSPGTATAASPGGPLVPGDASAFVADVTIPDGTVVGIGQRFVKTWKIANTGTVAWRGRFLRRADLPLDNGRCATPTLVPIPDTPPGAAVQISVPVMASDTPGSCWVGWKMVDDRGRYCFAGLRPVYFLVTVIDQTPPPGALPGAGALAPAPSE